MQYFQTLLYFCCSQNDTKNKNGFYFNNVKKCQLPDINRIFKSSNNIIIIS